MPRLRVTGAPRHAALVRRWAAERHAHLARSVRLACKGFATLAQDAHHLRQAGWPCKPPGARAVPKASGPVIRKGSASARAVPVASLCQSPVGLLKIGGQRRAARAGALRGGTPLGAVALTRLRAHAQDRAARRLSRALQAEWPAKSAGPGSVRARAARVSRGEHAAKPERCSQVMGCASPPLRVRRALLGAASSEGSRADRDRRRGDWCCRGFTSSASGLGAGDKKTRRGSGRP